jgi:hypothetical protein
MPTGSEKRCKKRAYALAFQAKIATGFGNMPYLFSVSQYPQFALNLALILVHEHLLLPKSGRLKKMSRE